MGVRLPAFVFSATAWAIARSSRTSQDGEAAQRETVLASLASSMTRSPGSCPGRGRSASSSPFIMHWRFGLSVSTTEAAPALPPQAISPRHKNWLKVAFWKYTGI